MSGWNDAELDRLGKILNSTKLAEQNCTSITAEFKCDSGNAALPKQVNNEYRTQTLKSVDRALISAYFDQIDFSFDIFMEKIPLWDLRNMLTELKTNHSLNISNTTYFEENFKLLETEICPEDQKTEYVNAPSEFFKNYAMNMTSTIDETGQVQMHLVYALIFAWFICYFTIIKGVKSSGKVVWFTAIFPYIVLLILVIRGCTLEGADKGIQYYIGKESDFSKVITYY